MSNTGPEQGPVIHDVEHVTRDIVAGINEQMFDAANLDLDAVEIPVYADRLEKIFKSIVHTLESRSLLIRRTITPDETQDLVEGVVELLGERGHVVGYRSKETKETEE